MNNVIDSFAPDTDHFFLSNFFEFPITLLRLGEMGFPSTYSTVEHFYQSCKAVDPKRAEAIANAPSASAAKKMGNDRKLTRIRPDWEAVKYDVMRKALAVKFAPSTDLADKLCDTGTAHLIEGNTWNDRIWGVFEGSGKNWLGWLLMAQRAFVCALLDG